MYEENGTSSRSQKGHGTSSPGLPPNSCPSYRHPEPKGGIFIRSLTSIRDAYGGFLTLKGFEMTNSLPRFEMTNSLPRFEMTNSLPRFEMTNSLPRFEMTNSLPRFETISHAHNDQGCDIDQSVEISTVLMKDHHEVVRLISGIYLNINKNKEL